MPERNCWRIDKHIPIAVLLGMLTQAATIIWWASSINTTVGDLKSDVTRIETKLDYTIASHHL